MATATDGLVTLASLVGAQITGSETERYQASAQTFNGTPWNTFQFSAYPIMEGKSWSHTAIQPVVAEVGPDSLRLSGKIAWDGGFDPFTFDAVLEADGSVSIDYVITNAAGAEVFSRSGLLASGGHFLIPQPSA